MNDDQTRVRRSDLAPFGQSGLDRFASALNPAVVSEIETWTGDHPLRPLLLNLQAQRHPKAFFDSYAEALAARHLLHRGCELRFEVPSPKGKQSDFEVRRDGQEFYLHVKRLDTERPKRRKLEVSSRLRMLERIERPYIVGVRWSDQLNDRQMQEFVRAAASFISRAQIGDEHIVYDADRRELGGIQIVAPWAGSHVTLVIGLPTGFIDEVPRIRKLMDRARRQFMPKALNVVMVGSAHVEDADDVETALLGSHIERWDAFPPRGRRVAHGRDADGLWHGRRHTEFSAASWFWLRPEIDRFDARLLFREGGRITDAQRELLLELFQTEEK